MTLLKRTLLQLGGLKTEKFTVYCQQLRLPTWMDSRCRLVSSTTGKSTVVEQTRHERAEGSAGTLSVVLISENQCNEMGATTRWFSELQKGAYLAVFRDPGVTRQ